MDNLKIDDGFLPIKDDSNFWANLYLKNADLNNKMLMLKRSDIMQQNQEALNQRTKAVGLLNDIYNFNVDDLLDGTDKEYIKSIYDQFKPDAQKLLLEDALGIDGDDWKDRVVDISKRWFNNLNDKKFADIISKNKLLKAKISDQENLYKDPDKYNIEAYDNYMKDRSQFRSDYKSGKITQDEFLNKLYTLDNRYNIYRNIGGLKDDINKAQTHETQRFDFASGITTNLKSVPEAAKRSYYDKIAAIKGIYNGYQKASLFFKLDGKHKIIGKAITYNEFAEHLKKNPKDTEGWVSQTISDPSHCNGDRECLAIVNEYNIYAPDSSDKQTANESLLSTRETNAKDIAIEKMKEEHDKNMKPLEAVLLRENDIVNASLEAGKKKLEELFKMRTNPKLSDEQRAIAESLYNEELNRMQNLITVTGEETSTGVSNPNINYEKEIEDGLSVNGNFNDPHVAVSLVQSDFVQNALIKPNTTRDMAVNMAVNYALQLARLNKYTDRSYMTYNSNGELVFKPEVEKYFRNALSHGYTSLRNDNVYANRDISINKMFEFSDKFKLKDTEISYAGTSHYPGESHYGGMTPSRFIKRMVDGIKDKAKKSLKQNREGVIIHISQPNILSPGASSILSSKANGNKELFYYYDKGKKVSLEDTGVKGNLNVKGIRINGGRLQVRAVFSNVNGFQDMWLDYAGKDKKELWDAVRDNNRNRNKLSTVTSGRTNPANADIMGFNATTLSQKVHITAKMLYENVNKGEDIRQFSIHTGNYKNNTTVIVKDADGVATAEVQFTPNSNGRGLSSSKVKISGKDKNGVPYEFFYDMANRNQGSLFDVFKYYYLGLVTKKDNQSNVVKKQSNKPIKSKTVYTKKVIHHR